MQKKTISLVVASNILIFAALIFSALTPSSFQASGKLTKTSHGNWGIRLDIQPMHILMRRTFTLVDVPSSLQHEGQQVRGTFRVTDVIGSSQWDTILKADDLSAR